MTTAASTPHWAGEIVGAIVLRERAAEQAAAEIAAARTRLRDVVTRNGPIFVAAIASEFEAITNAVNASLPSPILKWTADEHVVTIAAPKQNASVALSADFSEPPCVYCATRLDGSGGRRPFPCALDAEGRLCVWVDGALLGAADLTRVTVERWLNALTLS